MNKSNRFGGQGLALLAVVFVTGVLFGILVAHLSENALGTPIAGLVLILLAAGLAASLITTGWLIGRGQPSVTAADAVPPSASGVAEVSVGTPTLLSTSVTEPSALLDAPADSGTSAPIQKPAEKQVTPAGSAQQSPGWTIEARHLLGFRSVRATLRWNTRGARKIQAAMPGATTAKEPRVSLRSLPLLLFLGSLLVYAITRLVELDQFPINFFADEAVQVTNAMDLVHRGFRDAQGGLFPMYFSVFFFTNPDIAVYFHAVTASLFGQSIIVARATSAIVTLFAVAGLAYLLKEVFKARYWWSVVLLLAVMPVWFLHSRTAFDAVSMTALYALFITFYLLYRYRSPRFVYLALIFAAATFYAYPGGQLAIGLLSLFLVFSDLRYHWAHRRTLAWGALLGLVLAVPFIRFELLHPGEATYHLSQVNSYWTQNIPFTDKLARFADTYSQILSPTYWFLYHSPNQVFLMREEMKDYPYIPLIIMPLLLVGLAVAVTRSRESRYRALVAALLAAPIGGALVDLGVLRVLAFVVPVAVLSALGIDWLIERIKNPRVALSAGLGAFAVLTLMSGSMLDDALANGPRWYEDYTLYGMQWGAKQVFDEAIPQILADNPDSQVFVSDTWANGTDIFARFFPVDRSRVQIAGIDAWLQKKLPFPTNGIFIMTPDEYEKASASDKLQYVDVLDTIPYPDGRDGFYVTATRYVPNVDEIFAQEKDAQRALVTDQAIIDGSPATVSHTKLDMGTIQQAFDGSLSTLARGVEANPLVIDIQFASPRTVQKLSAYFGKANVHLTVAAYPEGGGDPVNYAQDYNYLSINTPLPAGKVAELSLRDGPAQINRLRLEIQYTQSDENAHVHVFDIQFDRPSPN